MFDYIDINVRKKWSDKIKIAQAVTDLGTMYYLLDENYNFIPLIKEYLDMVQVRATTNTSPNTIKTYCHLLWYFLVFLRINDLNILDLDGRPQILVDFKMWLMNPYRFYENIDIITPNSDYCNNNGNLSVSTINAIIGRVSSLYLWLRATNRIKENPVIYKSVLVTQTMKDRDLLAHTKHNKRMQVNSLISKAPLKLPKVVEPDSFNKLLGSVNLLRDKIILICLKEGGFRSGELLGIHLEDIDFGEQGLWVKFRPNNENGARAKSGYGSDRFVALPPDLMILIDNYISSEWIACNPTSDYLFIVTNSNNPSHNGKPMTKSTLDSIFKYYCIKAFSYTIVNNKRKPVKHVHPHMLRHTHATELAKEYLNNNQPINWKFISQRLGHSSVTTTIETYTHLSNGDYKGEYMKYHEYRILRGIRYEI